MSLLETEHEGKYNEADIPSHEYYIEVQTMRGPQDLRPASELVKSTTVK
jgi:hypothetical protein